jgi:multimeric flavodoxin WrbA
MPEFGNYRRKYYTVTPGSIRKVALILASPRKTGTSKTEMLANAFLEGCAVAGAAVEAVALRTKKIAHCTGCYTCWTKTPGVCIHRDDAADIMRIEQDADLTVYAFPLYHFGINSLLKKYIERTMPAIMPHLVTRADGVTTHPHREGYRGTRYAVIIGVCGFPEVGHFGAASANFHYLANASGDEGLNIIAELYRPASELLGNPFYKEETGRVFSAAKKAGSQVVREGTIDAGYADEIARVVGDMDKFRDQANAAWDHCIKEKKTMPELQDELARSMG